MLDITRLMYDEPEKYEAKARVVQSFGDLAVFTHRGKRWAAFRVMEPGWRGHGWHLDRRHNGDRTSYDMEWLLSDPQAFCQRWWDRYARPGWDHADMPDSRAFNFEQDDYIAIRFEELP